MLVINLPIWAQGIQPEPFEPKISAVKIFQREAEITRSGSIHLTVGDQMLVIKNLSPYLDEKSIRVIGDGEFKIMSVNYGHDHLAKNKKASSIKLLEMRQDSLQTLKRKLKMQQRVTEQTIDLLNKNKAIGPDQVMQTDELSRLLKFYSSELKKAESKKLKIRVQLEGVLKRLKQINDQINERVGKEEKPFTEIKLSLSVKEESKATFTVHYVVKNAGWYPKYDIRAKDVNSPVVINYKASVHQQTGEDWTNVKLIFSTINAEESGELPKLQPWRLNYERYTIRREKIAGFMDNHVREVRGIVVSSDGEPLPGVNVLVKGSTMGTVTDIDGRYSLTAPRDAQNLVFSFIGFATQEVQIDKPFIDVSLSEDVMALDEVEVTALGLSGAAPGLRIRGNSSVSGYSGTQSPTMVSASLVRSPTSVEFVIDEAFTIPSGGRSKLIDLKEYKVKSVYDYYAVPKLSPGAYLVAKIIDWNKLGFLDGEANLYFEEAFVGKSILSTATNEDTLRISLGRDRNVRIVREKVLTFTRDRSVGSNRMEKNGFELKVRNNKEQTIDVHLLDQIPVSVNNQISVDLADRGGALYSKDEGLLEWSLHLKPDESLIRAFSYVVKYPKRELVVLE